MRIGYVNDLGCPTWAISKGFFEAFNLGEEFYDAGRERRIFDRFLILPEKRARRILRAAKCFSSELIDSLLASAKMAQSVSLARLKELALVEADAIRNNMCAAA